MFPFKYDRYSKDVIKTYPHINTEIKKTISRPIITFEEYISNLEKQRGYKYSRQERRTLERKFNKRKK